MDGKKRGLRGTSNRAVTKGAAEATESGAHHDAAWPKQFRLNQFLMFQHVNGSSRDGRSVETGRSSIDCFSGWGFQLRNMVANG